MSGEAAIDLFFTAMLVLLVVNSGVLRRPARPASPDPVPPPRQSGWADDWRAIAQKLGLKYSRKDGSAMRGWLHGCRVEVALLPDGPSTEYVARIEVAPPHPVRVSLRMETLLDAAAKIAGANDVVTGDEEFDARVYVEGPAPEALAGLGQASRQAVLRLGRLGVFQASESGGLSFVLRAASRPLAAEVVPDLVQLAAGLARSPSTIPAALAARAAEDPVPAVRLRNLEALARHFRGTRETSKAAERALGDSSSRVQAKGLELLDERDACHLARVCELARDGTPEVAAAAARALGRFGDPAAEPTLIELLGTSSDQVREAAARALGSVGSLRCIEALVPIANGLLTGDDGEAARQAIKLIQARLGDVASGRVSLAATDDDAGALSLGTEGRDRVKPG